MDEYDPSQNDMDIGSGHFFYTIFILKKKIIARFHPQMKPWKIDSKMKISIFAYK